MLVLAPIRLALAAALVLAAPGVGAASYVDVEKRLTPEQRHATGLDTLSTAQLELLNRLLREDAAAEPATAKTERHDPPGGDSIPPRRGGYVGLDDQPVTAHAKGRIAGWEPGTVFELDNGQVWKVLKGSVTLRKPVESPEIHLIPGVAGRWFLEVDESMPKARVYRVD